MTATALAECRTRDSCGLASARGPTLLDPDLQATRAGRPGVKPEVRDLIRKMAGGTPFAGSPTDSWRILKLHRTYQKQKPMEDSRRELQVAQKLQAEERAQEESLVKAAGARGDPARGLGLVPPAKQEQRSPPAQP